MTDANTGLPISGAIINIPELEGKILRARTTDESGFYCRLLQPLASYSMIVSAYGYMDTVIVDFENSVSEPTLLSIPLNPAPLHEITFF